MKKNVSRRKFISKSATAAGAAVALPYFIPSGVLAQAGRPGANDRIITGHIGLGGRGIDLLNSEFKGNCGALCDVDADHLAGAHKLMNGSVKTYHDYRQLLEQKDLDAVVIAAPDHWHALQMIHACEAGKDVYCEKPACNTIAEGQAMVAAAKKHGRVVQIGSQGRSTPAAHAACQYIRNGMLGKVSKVTCWHPTNPEGGTDPDSNPPPTLDWDMWLGPAEWVKYNPKRTHFNFRWFLEYGGGDIRDRGAHVMSVALWCMNGDETGPVSIEAKGSRPKQGIFNVPPEMEVTYEFKNPDWTLVWSQPGNKESGAEFGAKYWGDKDTLVIDGGDGGCDTEAKAKNFAVPAGGVSVYKSPGHKQDFFNCIRTRGKTIMNIEAGTRVANLCVLGNLAYRLGRKLNWDPVAERFIGDEAANSALGRPGRKEWHL